MNQNASEKGQKRPQDPEKFIISGQIVEKAFYKKNGEPAGFNELYFRASIQDYFIKFCESNIDKDAISPYIDQSITVHAEIKDGEWDTCPDDPAEMQSRIGPYMVINAIK